MTLRYLPRRGDVVTCLADHDVLHVVEDWEEGILRSFWCRTHDGRVIQPNAPLPTRCPHPGCKYPFMTQTILAFHVRGHGWTSFEPQLAIPDAEAWDAGVEAHEARKLAVALASGEESVQ